MNIHLVCSMYSILCVYHKVSYRNENIMKKIIRKRKYTHSTVIHVKSVYKWTRAVHSHVVQGSTVLDQPQFLEWNQSLSKNLVMIWIMADLKTALLKYSRSTKIVHQNSSKEMWFNSTRAPSRFLSPSLMRLKNRTRAGPTAPLAHFSLSPSSHCYLQTDAHCMDVL